MSWLKERLQARIERDAVKSYLTYKKSDGEEVTEEVLLKRSKIPLVGDWGRIYPPLNEDGSWNFMNLIFGGYRNLIKLLTMMIILALLFYWVSGVIGVGKEYMDGRKYIIVPILAFEKFCQRAISEGGGQIVSFGNLSLLNITIIKEEG